MEDRNIIFYFKILCKVLPESNHVDLSVSFQTAYVLGLMIMIQDNSALRSIVNYSQNEAQLMLSQFPEEQTSAMTNLWINKTYKR